MRGGRSNHSLDVALVAASLKPPASSKAPATRHSNRTKPNEAGRTLDSRTRLLQLPQRRSPVSSLPSAPCSTLVMADPPLVTNMTEIKRHHYLLPTAVRSPCTFSCLKVKLDVALDLSNARCQFSVFVGRVSQLALSSHVLLTKQSGNKLGRGTYPVGPQHVEVLCGEVVTLFVVVHAFGPPAFCQLFSNQTSFHDSDPTLSNLFFPCRDDLCRM